MSAQPVQYPEVDNGLNFGSQSVEGEFITRDNERYYAIRNVDKMPAFFISVVSNSDHWLFVSSNGGVTAGRVSPETALFPYVPVDKVEDSVANTGCKTLFSVRTGHQCQRWEPFNEAHSDRFNITRNLYKNVLGNKLCFEEINHDLQLAFRYTWKVSDTFGFVRDCELENLGDKVSSIELVDGLQNILPAAAPREIQNTASNLVDAYKWSELDHSTGMAYYTLYSGITDKAAPAESMWANTVFCVGLDDCKILLSAKQLNNFKQARAVVPESCVRGVRGAYLVNAAFDLAENTCKQWRFVADVEQTQTQVVALRQQLQTADNIQQTITDSIDQGSNDLLKIIADVDGLQTTAEENVSVHHYANVLFNSMRGGVFDKQYQIDLSDFRQMLGYFNKPVSQHYDVVLETWSA
ncbi:MAG: hypothetical protein ACPG47_06425, partial [Leucothrix sp.]